MIGEPMRLILSKVIFFLLLISTGISSQRPPAYHNLQSFIDSCPQNDPDIMVIRRDFQILRNGKPVGNILCKEPYSKLPTSEVTDELVTIQALRFAYRMDMGRSNYLPWTSLRLYDWFKSRVAGFTIDTTLTGSTVASCCVMINGGRYITLSPLDDLNRTFRQTPEGLATLIALMAHETRHTDGFRHASCCGQPDSCDQRYDEKNLSPFGIQYYLAKQWLNGGVNLQYSCDPKTRVKSAMVFL